MKIGIVVAVVVAAVALNGTVHAAVISENLTGTVTSGSDDIGVFGGGNLTGSTIGFSFSYDTGILAADTSYYNNPGYEDQFADYSPDGAVSESVTANSQTDSMTSNFSGSLGLVDGCTALACGSDRMINYVENFGGNGAYIDVVIYSSLAYSLGQILSQPAVDAFVANETAVVLYIYDGTNHDTLTVGSVTGAAPEPAAWILLALGFGCIGSLKRRFR